MGRIAALYGDAEVQARAQAWAKAGGYRPTNRPPCGHSVMGTYHRMADTCQYEGPPTFLDHGRIWETADNQRFLLAHNYEGTSDVASATAYAEGFGLVVTQDPEDGWYGYGTTPLRLSLPAHLFRISSQTYQCLACHAFMTPAVVRRRLHTCTP